MPGPDPPAPPVADDRLAAALRGFGLLGVLVALLVVLGSGLLGPLRGAAVLLWAWRSRTPWRDLGLARPRHWPVTIAAGIALGVAFKLVMKSLVMPLMGAEAVNRAYHFLEGNPAALPGMLALVVLGAGFGEELVFRGFLFERLGRLLGSSRGAVVATVALTTLVFGAIHYPEQGLPGAQQATVVALVFGSVYAATRRLWLLVFAHAAFDVTAVLMIFWGQETRVARWFFH